MDFLMPTKHRSNHGGQSKVRNSKALGQLIQEVVRPQFETEQEAAAAIGLSRVAYWRLSNGQTGAVTAKTATGLFGVVPEDRWAELMGLLWSPEDQALAALHLSWLLERLRPYHLGGKPIGNFWLQKVPKIEKKGRRARLLDRVLRDLDSVGPDHPGGKSYTDLIREFLALRRTMNGNDRLRGLLSVVRLLEPLLDAEETSGTMERTWRELHESGTLERYLVRGFLTQKLLRRKP